MTSAGAPTLTVLGSINMDLVVRTGALPAPGQTLLGTGFSTICGGKGANQAIAAARAGGRVQMLGAVGDDPFAETLRANLIAADVRAGMVRTVAGPSGIASIMVDDSGENVIVVVAGANGAMTELTAVEQELIGASDMVICQLEIPLATVIQAAAIVAAAGRTFILNPSPVQSLPAPLAANIGVLVLNEGEAAAIGAVVDTVPHVITTLGSKGARYRGPDGESFSVAAPAVTAVDTTGAGDAFTGALAVAWSQRRSALAAVRWAVAAGSLATTVEGASSSSPSREAIDALVRSQY